MVQYTYFKNAHEAARFLINQRDNTLLRELLPTTLHSWEYEQHYVPKFNNSQLNTVWFKSFVENNGFEENEILREHNAIEICVKELVTKTTFPCFIRHEKKYEKSFNCGYSWNDIVEFTLKIDKII